MNVVRLSLAVAIGSLAFGASAALAGGGSTIADAPNAPIGQQVVSGTTSTLPHYCNISGGDPGEFWRVPLGSGDQLVVDFGSTNGNTVYLHVLPPSVTDYTLGQARCLAEDETDSKSELRFTAGASGRYTLVVAALNDPFAYEMTVHVRHYTHTTITGPSVVRAHAQVTVKGRVSGISAGKVAIQSRIKRRWKTLTLTSVKSNGRFSYKTHVGAPGRYRGRVVYFGDASHLPSSAVFSVRVA